MTRQLPRLPRRTNPSRSFWLQRRRTQIAVWNAYVLRQFSDADQAPEDVVTTNWDRLIECADRPLTWEIVRPLTEADLALLRPAKVPVLCEWLMCLAVEPEFHEDRLGDYQERFNDLWVPKFGRRGAVAVYVWHVLRQSRLIDWLLHAFGWGDPQ
jgi:hypothetical protein